MAYTAARQMADQDITSALAALRAHRADTRAADAAHARAEAVHSAPRAAGSPTPDAAAQLAELRRLAEAEHAGTVHPAEARFVAGFTESAPGITY